MAVYSISVHNRARLLLDSLAIEGPVRFMLMTAGVAAVSRAHSPRSHQPGHLLTSRAVINVTSQVSSEVQAVVFKEQHDTRLKWYHSKLQDEAERAAREAAVAAAAIAEVCDKPSLACSRLSCLHAASASAAQR